MSRLLSLIVLALGLAHAASAGAQDPKPVTLVSPFAAGGPTDVVARVLAQSMTRTLGQTVIVENAVAVPAEQATPEALQKFLKAEIDKYGPVIRKAGVYAD